VQLERGDGKEGGGGPKEGKGGEVEDPQRGNGVVNCVKSVDVKCVD